MLIYPTDYDPSDPLTLKVVRADATELTYQLQNRPLNVDQILTYMTQKQSIQHILNQNNIQYVGFRENGANKKEPLQTQLYAIIFTLLNKETVTWFYLTEEGIQMQLDTLQYKLSVKYD